MPFKAAYSKASRSAVPAPSGPQRGAQGPHAVPGPASLTSGRGQRGLALHRQTARAGPGAVMTQGPETAGKRKVSCR